MLNELLNNLDILLNKKFTWSQQDYVQTLISNKVWSYVSKESKCLDPLAYATRNLTNGVYTYYKVFINKNIIPSAVKPLEMHEFGHIVFSHLDLSESNKRIQQDKIKAHWPVLLKHLDDDLKNDLNNIEGNDNKLCKQVLNMFLNIAMDYEINSKFFPTDEEKYNLKLLTNVAYIKALISTKQATDDDIEKFFEWSEYILGKSPKPDFLKPKSSKDKGSDFVITPCFPDDVGFPKGLDYGKYLDLIVMDFDLFMNNFISSQGLGGDDSDSIKTSSSKGSNGGNSETKTDSNKSKDSKGNSSESPKQGNEQDSNQSQVQGDPQINKLSKKDLMDLMDSVNDSNNESNKNKLQDELNDSDNNPNQSKGDSPTKRHFTDDILSIRQHKKLDKIITDFCFNKQHTNTRVDNLYYYNRRKHNNNILTPRKRTENRYKPGNVYCLVDVSGSVRIQAIKSILDSVKRVSKLCGRFSRVVLWTTELVSDYKMTDPISDEYISGGTDITKGIAYIKKYLKHPNDKLIIISDYEDCFYSPGDCWYSELRNIKNDKMGICWFSNNDCTSFPESPSQYLSNIRYLEESFNIESFLKELPTVLVDLD